MYTLPDGKTTENRLAWAAAWDDVGRAVEAITGWTVKGLDFDVVLKEAQRLGYAEADPSFDIDGIDAALAGLRTRGDVDFPRIRAADFPPPTTITLSFGP